MLIYTGDFPVSSDYKSGEHFPQISVPEFFLSSTQKWVALTQRNIDFFGLPKNSFDEIILRIISA